ncbi:uncharacterized protein [Misgurnus anguillicaudatus]|uniref:uncharacterized protein isoform X2 n=1 Tax=Misgurnus anguillicaudatus TaxID=75329 RepID=UPI002435ECF9|nr:uncharacterized protein si:ch211-13c6.2 isoform X2 [Misgurnus anguillicaudatus]
MADLLTVYDDDQANTFIDCRICNKRIRGETQYKVHVTTLQHLKKEDALVAKGVIPRQPALPQWTDIRDYLKYLDLDEPIIGLDALVQIPDLVDDGKSVLKYKCKMCFVEMDLFSMVAHIVGRKHRQKYLELKRPDLVTWHDTETAQTQPGLVAKAKAAVVEKQEGWGTPEQLKKPQANFGNVGKGSNSRSSVREQPHLGRNSQRQSSIEDRQPYSNKGRSERPYHPMEKYDQYDGPNPRPYGEPAVRGTLREEYSERVKRDMNARPYGDQGGGMRRPEEGYEDGNFGRKLYSSEEGHGLVARDYDFQENVYHDDAPRNRYNDRDLRIHNSGQSYGDAKSEEGHMDARMYSSYEERRPDVDAMSKYGRSLSEKEERGNFREYDSWTQSSYSGDPVPAKKKRKSRFSDATAEEIAITNSRHSIDYDHKSGQRPQNTQRGPPMQGIPSLFDIPAQDSGSTSSFNPKGESVLDVLNDIKIENMEDAKYLKERLCTVLKEFQASKGSRSEGHTSVSDYRGGKQMDQQRDAYDNTLRDDPGMNRGFQEDRRYDDDPRNFQDSRRYEDDPRALQDSKRYEDDPRAFQDSKRYEDDPRAFQDSKRYEDDPRAFQDSRQYEDDPKALQEARQYEDDPRGSRDNRHYEEPRRYENYPGNSSFREARQDADDPRGFPKTRLQDKSIDFSEGRSYDNDLRVNYEGYSKGTQDFRPHAEDPRSAQEARYYDDDYRGFENLDAGRKWDPQMSSLDDKGPVDERGFQASFGNPHKSPLGETRMYAARGRQRSHQDVRYPGDEVYDPFQPSPSPPPASTNSTSLNKIASTLLELVSRR